jgi:hypothetical protein
MRKRRVNISKGPITDVMSHVTEIKIIRQDLLYVSTRRVNRRFKLNLITKDCNIFIHQPYRMNMNWANRGLLNDW